MNPNNNNVRSHWGHVPGRVPTPPGKSWIFFFKIPGPGKSWKITLVLGPTSKGRGWRTGVRRRGKGYFFIFKHLWAPKSSWEISHGGSGKVLDFCQ